MPPRRRSRTSTAPGDRITFYLGKKLPWDVFFRSYGLEHFPDKAAVNGIDMGTFMHFVRQKFMEFITGAGASATSSQFTEFMAAVQKLQRDLDAVKAQIANGSIRVRRQPDEPAATKDLPPAAAEGGQEDAGQGLAELEIPEFLQNLVDTEF